MDITDTQNGSMTVVAVMGDVDASTAPQLRARLDELMAEGRENFVVDLDGVAFLDSSGLATLVHAFKRVRIGNGDLVLARLRPEVRSLFALTRLERVFAIWDDVDSAVASLAEAAH
jgi:anti-sigma B factor antagonist